MRYYYFWLAIFLMNLGCAMNPIQSNSAANVPGANQNQRVKLVFVIDQGWGNGPINKRDVVGMQNTLDALKPLQKKYDVFPLFATHVANRENFNAILDLCVENGFAFFFDVMSSDGMTIAGAPQTKPFDETHGQEIGLEELTRYKERYGDWLAGIRFMEIFGQDFMVMNFDKYPEWQHEGYSKMPDTSIRFFDVAIVREYLAFAQKTGMTVQWSEFHWVRDPMDDPYHATRLIEFQGLLDEFPNLVTVTYANNQPGYASLKRLGDWTQDIKSIVAMGAKDFGLSDQSWIYNLDPMNCPPELIINWADSALNFDCEYIQFEPGFFFFNYPMGSLLDDGSDYTRDPVWTERGHGRIPFTALSEFLISR